MSILLIVHFSEITHRLTVCTVLPDVVGELSASA